MSLANERIVEYTINLSRIFFLLHWFQSIEPPWRQRERERAGERASERERERERERGGREREKKKTLLHWQTRTMHANNNNKMAVPGFHFIPLFFLFLFFSFLRVSPKPGVLHAFLSKWYTHRREVKSTPVLNRYRSRTTRCSVEEIRHSQPRETRSFPTWYHLQS